MSQTAIYLTPGISTGHCRVAITEELLVHGLDNLRLRLGARNLPQSRHELLLCPRDRGRR
jgi:hypothetical protein